MKAFTSGDATARAASGRTRRSAGDPAPAVWLSRVKQLLAAYLALSLATVVAIVLLRHDAAAVNTATWTRGTIVAASALLTFSFAVRAARGSARAFLRLRVISGIMLVAIAVIIALPGAFPEWVKLEQAACGVLLLAVVALLNGPRLRSAFSAA